MASQVKILVDDRGKKSAATAQTALTELQFLTSFNQSVTSSLARSVSDLSQTTFTDLANVTLARRDAYLEFIRPGVKPDTLLKLRTSPVHTDALFPDELLQKAEAEIVGPTTHVSGRQRDRVGHPYRNFHSYQAGATGAANAPRQGPARKPPKFHFTPQQQHQRKPGNNAGAKPYFSQKAVKGHKWRK